MVRPSPATTACRRYSPSVLSQRWQGTLTYTLSTLKRQRSAAGERADRGAVRRRAGVRQRLWSGSLGSSGTARSFNGIWERDSGFQLSGICFYGSGERASRPPVVAASSARLTGAAGSDRLRLNGTITPRNGFVGLPIHRVDMRLQRHFKMTSAGSRRDRRRCSTRSIGRTTAGYVTNEANPQYGQPISNANLSYAPRSCSSVSV